MYVCAHAGGTCICIWSSEVILGCHSSGAVHLALATGSLFGTQGFLVRMGWLASEPSKPLVSFPALRSQVHAITWVLWTKLKSSLHSKRFTK